MLFQNPTKMTYNFPYPRIDNFPIFHRELETNKFYIIHLYNNPTKYDGEFMLLCGIFIKKEDNALYFKQVIKSEYNYKFLSTLVGNSWNYTRYENPDEEFSVFDSKKRCFHIYNDLFPQNAPFLLIPRELNEFNFDYFMLRNVSDMYCNATQRKNMTGADYDELNYLIKKYKMNIEYIKH